GAATREIGSRSRIRRCIFATTSDLDDLSGLWCRDFTIGLCYRGRCSESSGNWGKCIWWCHFWNIAGADFYSIYVCFDSPTHHQKIACLKQGKTVELKNPRLYGDFFIAKTRPMTG